jgi:chromate reductase, NAD(P)H dehydrogenase (quinone)
LALTASDAVLIAPPEYGFSLPCVLKNGIDWLIGSGELEQKVVTIAAAVAGPERGRRGLEALRDTLSAERATIVRGDSIAKGPELESQVASPVRALVEAAAAHRDVITIPLDRRFADSESAGTLSEGRYRCLSAARQ